MPYIILTQNQRTLIDEEDTPLMQHKWCAAKDKSGKYYAVRQVPGGSSFKRRQKTLYLHVVIAERCGFSVKNQVDHRDGNTLNNSRSNLRSATAQQNQFNKRKIRKATSPFKGVSWSTKERKWHVAIKKNRKSVFVGQFRDEKIAALSYDDAARVLHGDFARCNFPGVNEALDSLISCAARVVKKLG